MFILVRGTIPFWKFGGDAVVTDDYLRLTPAEKSRNGWIFGTKVMIELITTSLSDQITLALSI